MIFASATAAPSIYPCWNSGDPDFHFSASTIGVAVAAVVRTKIVSVYIAVL
ncbi:MAG: hypothetical protein ACJ71R_01285 [Nitrososphaeraceae archaeon]